MVAGCRWGCCFDPKSAAVMVVVVVVVMWRVTCCSVSGDITVSGYLTGKRGDDAVLVRFAM